MFRRTIADMFSGERNIPDIVRDNMKLEDFNKGKPLTARRINLVRIAIDSLGGGKFNDPASVGKATAMGYVASELPKLAAYSLGQGQLGQLKCLANHGLFVNEHIPVQYTISKNDETGAISIFIKEPENFPVKFNWTVTVAVDGSSVSTPMRLDHGQYEAKAMTFADKIADKLPGKDEASAKNIIRNNATDAYSKAGEGNAGKVDKLIKIALKHCAESEEAVNYVAANIDRILISGKGTLRTLEEVREISRAVVQRGVEGAAIRIMT